MSDLIPDPLAPEIAVDRRAEFLADLEHAAASLESAAASLTAANAIRGSPDIRHAIIKINAAQRGLADARAAGWKP